MKKNKLLILLGACLVVISVSLLGLKALNKPAETIIETNNLDVISSEKLVQNNLPFQIPDGIQPNQIQKLYFIDETYYAIYQKNNLNYPIGAHNDPPTRSGILYANEGDGQWKTFFEITELGDNKNNPVNFWKERGDLYVLIADAGGAGSGEGIAKLMKSEEDKSWIVVKCFYLTPELFYETVEVGIEEGLTITQSINLYLEGDNAGLSREYEFDPNTGNFIDNHSYTVENCQDFQLNSKPS